MGLVQRPRLHDSWVSIAVLGAALLLSHPYTGIRHDGILYFGDALARLIPGEFHDDPYFAFGSQGRFTLLPIAYAWLVSRFGVGEGTAVGLFAAFMLQVAATWSMASCLTSRRLRAICTLSVVLGWALYGGLRIFAYGEPFLTARSFAEPLLLLGLAALMRKRYVAAGVGLVAGLLIHPLMGSGAVLLAGIWLFSIDRRWLLLPLAGVGLLLLAGWLKVPPFDDVFSSYDAQWYALVVEANPQAFVSLWSLSDFGPLFLSATVLCLAVARVDDTRVRRAAGAALAAGLLCVATSFVTVDLLRNAFFGKIQIWRALWLTQWFAMLLFPLVFVTLRRRGESGRIAAFLLAIGWMAPFTAAPAIVAVFAVVLDRFGHRIEIGKSTTRMVGWLVAVIAFVIVAQQWGRAISLGLMLEQPWRAIAGRLLALNLVIGILALIALKGIPRRPWTRVAFTAGLCIVAVVAWDQRTPWTKRMESYAIGLTIWPGVIEPAAKVYWYRDLIAPWILLGHANYYTQQQGSGAVFSRTMMLELDQRRKVTAILDFQEQLCRMMNGLNEKANSCEPDGEAVKNVCVDGAIDYVVLQSGLEGVKAVASYKTGVVENGYEKTFFLYRCAALTKG